MVDLVLEERLGLAESIVMRSSDSGSIHLWYWFAEAQNSYQLAAAVAIMPSSRKRLVTTIEARTQIVGLSRYSVTPRRSQAPSKSKRY